MNTQEKNRWLEIQLYFFVTCIMKMTYNNFATLNSIIDGLAHFGGYNAPLVKQAAYMIVSDMRYKPGKREISHLGRRVIGRTRVHRNTGISMASIHQYLQYPEPMIAPRLPKPIFDEVKKFLNCYYTIQGVIK